MGLAQTRESTGGAAPAFLRQTAARLGRLRYPLVSIGVILLLWQIIGGILPPIFLSTPPAVARALVQLIGSGELLRNLWLTLTTFVIGLALPTIVGIPAGLIAGRYQAVSNYTELPIRIFYSLPTI